MLTGALLELLKTSPSIQLKGGIATSPRPNGFSRAGLSGEELRQYYIQLGINAGPLPQILS
jgi:hypothetical protein